MSAPATIPELLDLIRQSGAIDLHRLEDGLSQLAISGIRPADPRQLATVLVRQGIMTRYQAIQLLQGRLRDLSLGKYLILEQLGSGGMGVVYLAEHKLLRRHVALKVLPIVLARDPWFRDQFYQEARAVAALNHPNIVRAHDVDCAHNIHFLVMEYVDGSNLHDIVRRRGPFPVCRAAHYVSQAAKGLHHAFGAGLVHRDIKPGNLLLERRGTVKVLDLGLACFLRDRAEAAPVAEGAARLTVGTDDYLAPEQVIDSDDVDTRADVYGLGATLYYLLTGQAPFADVELPSQKLVAHLTRGPRPVTQVRADIPETLAAVVQTMMAKNPWERYQTPAGVAEALTPWTRTPIPPPPPEEMPALSAGGLPTTSGRSSSTVKRGSSGRKTWVVCGAPGMPGAAPLASSTQVSASGPNGPGQGSSQEHPHPAASPGGSSTEPSAEPR